MEAGNGWSRVSRAHTNKCKRIRKLTCSKESPFVSGIRKKVNAKHRKQQPDQMKKTLDFKPADPGTSSTTGRGRNGLTRVFAGNEDVTRTVGSRVTDTKVQEPVGRRRHRHLFLWRGAQTSAKRRQKAKERKTERRLTPRVVVG